MAEASIQFLLENLSSLIKAEIGLILGVDDDINNLSSNLTAIQAVLRDAEDKQLENESVRDWLHKLNQLSFEIEDILDECVTELAMMESRNTISKVFSLKKVLYKRNIARRMKDVTRKLDIVAAERATFNLTQTTVVLQSKLSAAMRETGSVLNQAHLVLGREEERDKIIDILLNKFRDVQEFSVLPIIGLGGLGKTTFAQLVFNDERVTNHFDFKLWICVSDDFDLKTLIKAMITSATKSENDSSLKHLDALNLYALQHRLFQLLHQKRYLMVLDDVWNENQEKWSVLKKQLACGSTGSSIMVTTRLKKVAELMATAPAHCLKGLSEENGWLLFKERAFGHEEGVYTEFEAIGRQIVNKCAGVPLAATTLGGLLRYERKKEDWIRVEESPIWSLPQEECSILPALRLSYNHLPLTHRQCFAYCAVFPKDSVMWKEELIRQWMAHEYISSDGTSEVEEIGDKIFSELVLRSLFLNVIAGHKGRISFQMHDLVHDLAQSIMDNKVPRPQSSLDSTSISSSGIRHVNLQMRYAAFPWRIISNVDLLSVFTQFNRLKSLDANWSGISVVPPAIGKLKQLRYLNLSYNHELKTLPEELCSLWNLKILDLNGCRKLERLPKGMRELCNLHCVFLENCYSLRQTPPKLGELTSLKTMCKFIVRRKRDHQIRELQSLHLFGGDLQITNLERVKKKYLDANRPILAEKQKLRNLTLNWENGSPSRRRESMDEKVMEVLEPHPNVEALSIDGFQGKNITLWRGSSNPQIKLVKLYIENCSNCKALPQALVEFPHLKKLTLLRLPALEYIVDDEGCDLRSVKFPALEDLEFLVLQNLKSLLKKETGESFPNLKKLKISGCSSLSSLPQLPSLVDLRCSNNNITSVGGNFENLSTLIVWVGAGDVGVPKECLTNNLKSLEIWCATDDEDILPEEGFEQGLKSLKELTIYGGRLRCLPGRWLSHLTSLEKLSLLHCHEMVEIPKEGMKYLINLKELIIFDCPKIESIPSTIQQLRQLQTLEILLCSPELKKRCEKEKGDDWHKIKHIPNIYNG